MTQAEPSWMAPASRFEAFEQLALARRSSMLIDRERPVPRALLERLCRLVFSAPNHRRTSPWQVAVFSGDARDRLGAALADDLLAARPDTDPAKLAKTRTKYGRAPTIVVIASRHEGDDPIRHREDLAAVAAGVENLLLGASAAGLQCLWSSPPSIVSPRTCELAGFAPGTELVAVVYVGWPASEPPPPDRPDMPVAFHGDG